MSCFKREAASGLYAFVEVGRSKQPVRSVLLSHRMSAIIVRELQVKCMFCEIVLKKKDKRKGNIRSTQV